MSVGKVIGKNIEELMKNKSISQRKIAEVIGVTHPTVGSYLKGDQIIDSQKLAILAKYFNVPFDYFFVSEHKKLNLLFRADKPSDNIEDFDFQEIYNRFEDYITIVDLKKMKYIPQMYNLDIQKNKLTKDDKKNIEEVANEVRKQFSIEEVIPSNYYEIVEREGINVIALPHSNENFFGASSYSSDYGSFIFVNSNKDITEERQIFSLFHELGHLLFNRNEYKQYDYDPLYKSNRNIDEKIANQFAGYFLLPRDLVDNYIKERNKNVNLNDMKKNFKVSIQTLYMSLHEYGYINKTQYSEFWKKLHNDGLKKVEPDPLPRISIEDKNNRLISSMKNLYMNEDISVNRIAEVLNINLIEARKLIKDWSVSIEQYEKL
jgi:Zn-dependent peptidase ImmA (M78 family)/transcriptional regulator with XRE-family HTH domain